MTRIGRVTVKIVADRGYAPTVIQEIMEGGKAKRATFKFECCVYRPDLGRVYNIPGGIIRMTHLRYRRAA